jgi:hypothetical protein
MLQALFYCHKHHIVHCDLKPASTTHLWYEHWIYFCKFQFNLSFQM